MMLDLLQLLRNCKELELKLDDKCTVEEIGDGNLNFIFKVCCSDGSIYCVKRACPFVRIVPTWKLSSQRIHYEHNAMKIHSQFASAHVPKIYHFDDKHDLMVQEYLNAHVVLRKGLIQNQQFPLIGCHIGEFLASVLFHTSDLYLPNDEKSRLTSDFCLNHEMCHLSQQVIFTCPYMKTPSSFQNRWTSPQLDDAVAAIQSNDLLWEKVQKLKAKFMNCPEALIHGDLHTGSIMVTATDTKVIDAEFAFFGPMGFDIGAMIANLLISAASKIMTNDETNMQQYLYTQIVTLWETFSTKFLHYWLTQQQPDGRTTERMKTSYLQQIFQDALGFAGCKMIRRVVGVAHVEDLESISNPNLRAKCERAVLRMAIELIFHPRNYKDIHQVVTMAQEMFKESTNISDVFDPPPATLVVLSKWPMPGIPCKTRLGGGAQAAQAIAMAALKDVLHQLESNPHLQADTHRVLLYAPLEARDLVLKHLETMSKKWDAVPVDEAPKNIGSSNLGNKLVQAMNLSIAGPTVLFGMDCLLIEPSEIAAAIQAAHEGFAYISPANDGGYVMLALPKNARTSCFDDVVWSTSATCVSQIQALTRAGINVKIGKWSQDLDTPEDVQHLWVMMKDSDKLKSRCPEMFNLLSTTHS